MQTRRAPKKLDPDGLWDYALRVLAQRPHSSAELKQKLSRRADSPVSINTVLNKLREYGLANDANFSETFAAARLQNQGFGRMRVMRDLQAKRVARSVAEKAVDKTFAGIEEHDLARQFLERKYRGKNLPDFLQDQKNLAAAYRRLRTAGFSGRTSIEVLKAFSKKIEAFEDLADE